MEKMLLRSPEISLAVIAAFFSFLPAEISTSTEIRQKFLPTVVTSSKSITLPTRSATIQLFDILFTQSSNNEESLQPYAAQIYAPLKLGKTSSPDHRTTLFTMIGSLPASKEISTELVSVTLSLLAKEGNDVTFSAMMRVLRHHLPTSLAANASLTTVELAALIKGMQELKPTIRRAVCSTVGDVLWALPSDGTLVGEAANTFSVGILPGLEFSLKTMLSNPLNSPAGPLEGYIAVAVLKGRMARWGVKAIGTWGNLSECV